MSTEKTNEENDWKARVPRSVHPSQQSKATSEPSSKASALDTPSLDTKSPQSTPKGSKRYIYCCVQCYTTWFYLLGEAWGNLL